MKNKLVLILALIWLSTSCGCEIVEPPKPGPRVVKVDRVWTLEDNVLGTSTAMTLRDGIAYFADVGKAGVIAVDLESGQVLWNTKNQISGGSIAMLDTGDIFVGEPILDNTTGKAQIGWYKKDGSFVGIIDIGELFWSVRAYSLSTDGKKLYWGTRFDEDNPDNCGLAMLDPATIVEVTPGKFTATPQIIFKTKTSNSIPGYVVFDSGMIIGNAIARNIVQGYATQELFAIDANDYHNIWHNVDEFYNGAFTHSILLTGDGTLIVTDYSTPVVVSVSTGEVLKTLEHRWIGDSNIIGNSLYVAGSSNSSGQAQVIKYDMTTGKVVWDYNQNKYLGGEPQLENGIL